MQVQVLGCWAPYPAPNQACSGYLVDCGGKKVLVDCGHGAFSKLQAVSSYKELDAVFLSHFHPDHAADLSCLRHAVLGGMRQKTFETKIPLYVPDDPASYPQALRGFEDAFDIFPYTIEEPGEIDICGLRCPVFRGVHPVPTFGIAFVEGHNKMVYTSDTGARESLADFCRDADLLLCEASLSENDAHLTEKGHLTARQAGTLANDAGARALVLTHFWPEYDLRELLGEARETYDGPVEMASEFAGYSVGLLP